MHSHLLVSHRRCLALVHHGGVGTTAAGLLMARPTLVVPSFGDLFMGGVSGSTSSDFLRSLLLACSFRSGHAG